MTQCHTFSHTDKTSTYLWNIRESRLDMHLKSNNREIKYNQQRDPNDIKESPEYIKDIQKIQEHMIGEGMRPCYILSTLDTHETCPVDVQVYHAFLRSIFKRRSRPGVVWMSDKCCVKPRTQDI